MKTGRYVWRLKVGTSYKLTLMHYAKVWSRWGCRQARVFVIKITHLIKLCLLQCNNVVLYADLDLQLDPHKRLGAEEISRSICYSCKVHTKLLNYENFLYFALLLV